MTSGPRCYVYFIRRADGVGPVKIGCSAVPEERLSALMTWSPYPLAIVARIPGDLKLEGRFHARFAAQHSHREWFEPSADLYRVIEEIAAGTFDISSLPRHRRVTVGKRVWTPSMRVAVQLSMRLGRLQWGAGIFAPCEFEALLNAMRRPGDDDHSAAVAEIEAHLADPLSRGHVGDYQWARENYVGWSIKRAAA